MVHCWIVALTIHVHCSSLKPILADENKWVRMEMAWHLRDHVNPTQYQDMANQIHLDEKWFFPTQEKEIYDVSNINHI